MKIINVSYNNRIKLEDEVCAAIGNFDGVHLGHQQLINESKIHNLKSAVLTFSPHPNVILKKLPYYPLLTPMNYKMEIFELLNIDYLIIVEFDLAIATMDKNDFIDMLKQMNIKVCVCGYDFTFGYKATGTVIDLKQNFIFHEIPKFTIDGVRVSTTYIKELLSEGLIEDASKLLGRQYAIKSKVVHGNKIGSKIGFPTANIDITNYFIPKNGVYMCKVIVNKFSYLGVCNIGFNPTINFSETKKIEIHIIDFNENIYEEIIEIHFYDRIRNEKKFNNKEELIKQLENDVLVCLKNKRKIMG